MTRGYFGIGIENAKTPVNIGTLWRSANIFGASFIFTINHRYGNQSSDTLKTPRDVPLFHFSSFEEFKQGMPVEARLVGLELSPNAKPIATFVHPETCVYLLGAEDNGLSKKALAFCDHLLVLPGEFSLNVAVAGSIVLYDRLSK